MMFDYTKLRERIIKTFGNYEEFAERVGCTLNHITNVLNNERELTRGNISEWALVLSVPADEIESYFFTERR